MDYYAVKNSDLLGLIVLTVKVLLVTNLCVLLVEAARLPGGACQCVLFYQFCLPGLPLEISPAAFASFLWTTMDLLHGMALLPTPFGVAAKL